MSRETNCRECLKLKHNQNNQYLFIAKKQYRIISNQNMNFHKKSTVRICTENPI